MPDQPPKPESPRRRDPLTILIAAAWIVGLAAVALAIALPLGLWPTGTNNPPATTSRQNPIPQAMRPDSATAAALKTPPFHIRRVTDTPRHLFADLGLDTHAFQIKTRPNRRVYLWVELYKDGQLQPSQSFGVMKESQPDRPIHTTLRFTRLDPQTTRPPDNAEGNAPHRVRWTLGIGASALPRWLDDPRAGYGLQGGSGSQPTTWELGSGNTRTLWHHAAATQQTGSVQLGDESERRQNDLYIALRCRVAPADPDRSGSTFKSLHRVPPE